MELSELSSQQEASLFRSGLKEWQEGPQVLTYGAILICRKGMAMLNVNYKDWETVMTIGEMTGANMAGTDMAGDSIREPIFGRVIPMPLPDR